MSHPRRPGSRAQRGLTLIEVLVAVVLVSLGMLGILAGNTRGFANVNSAGYRYQATLAAQDIIERARANNVGNYTVDYGATTSSDGSAITAGDIQAWKAQLARSMPSGDASIAVTTTVDATTGASVRLMRVLVRWDDRRASGEKGSGSTATDAELKYFLTETYLAPARL